jgi:hypothetical protein
MLATILVQKFSSVHQQLLGQTETKKAVQKAHPASNHATARTGFFLEVGAVEPA